MNLGLAAAAPRVLLQGRLTKKVRVRPGRRPQQRNIQGVEPPSPLVQEGAGRVDDADLECLAPALLNTVLTTARLHRRLLLVRQIALLSMESAKEREAARPGDQESWWGKREDGSEVLCRVLRAGKEPKMRSLHGDPRLERYAELCDLPMEHKQGPGDKDGLAILWKQPGVEEGLGDLPWHRDCGMGGHASMCPTAVTSIFLGPNTKKAGQIRFLPGSWKSSFPFTDGNDAGAPEGVAPAAEPGDITLHYGDGLHVAPPPTGSEGPFRSCILMGYGRTGGGHHAGGRHYNDILLGNADGQVEDMRKIAKRR